VSLVCLSVAFLSGQFDGMAQHIIFGITTTLIFFVFSVIVYVAANLSVDSPNRTRFIGLTISNMLGKMLISVAVVLIYHKVKNPSNTLFIIPFLLIYIIFTIFETHFLIQIANHKKT
jgi:phosphatidylserine synthase